MSALRTPTVGGLAGGVGTSTVARALRGRDLGPVSGRLRLPDVVVCRATVSGLERAARVAPAAPTPARPVLAVTLEGPHPAEGPLAERLRDQAGWAALVPLPRVERWALARDPLAEASTLLGRPVDELPDALRGYAAALTRLVAALTDGGRLERADDEPEDGTGALRPVRGVRVGPPPPARHPAPWTVPAARLAW